MVKAIFVIEISYKLFIYNERYKAFLGSLIDDSKSTLKVCSINDIIPADEEKLFNGARNIQELKQLIANKHMRAQLNY